MLTIYSDQDQVAKGGEQRFIAEVPGCKGQPHGMPRRRQALLARGHPGRMARAIHALAQGDAMNTSKDERRD
ncbi:MAG TPA: hypothetical protein EYQ60_14265 [Myxococcales bacterium]|nr:hypothetical protein [Myxococcales bacterium]